MCSAFILFQCHPVICGVQGRYFMPVAPLLLLMFDNKKLVATKLPLFLAAVIPLLSIGAFAALITRFYG